MTHIKPNNPDLERQISGFLSYVESRLYMDVLEMVGWDYLGKGHQWKEAKID